MLHNSGFSGTTQNSPVVLGFGSYGYQPPGAAGGTAGGIGGDGGQYADCSAQIALFDHEMIQPRGALAALLD